MFFCSPFSFLGENTDAEEFKMPSARQVSLFRSNSGPDWVQTSLFSALASELWSSMSSFSLRAVQETNCVDFCDFCYLASCNPVVMLALSLFVFIRALF